MNKAIIVDLDGTLCNIDHRMKYIDGSMGKKDWDKFYDGCIDDKVNEWCYDLLKAFVSHNVMFRDTSTIPTIHLLYITGRPETIRSKTYHWIYSEAPVAGNLYMRKDGDFRKDSIIKKEIYEREVKGKYDILFAIDDRQQVVDMWREQGLVCLQCAKGDF